MAEMMNAVVWRAPASTGATGAFVDEQLPKPEASAPHDLLVEVKAVAVNPVDMKVARGTAPGAADRVLGWDAAGVVRAVGPEATLFQPGDAVFYAGALNRPGSFEQYQLVDERLVGHMPASLSFAQAAALPLTSLTAWECLFDKLALTQSTTGTLLVLGGAGGVGSMVVQLAKGLTRLKVIATASRPESKQWALRLGADATVDYTAADYAEQILAAAPGGVDYTFTSQSKGCIPLLKQVMRPFGQIVAIDDEPDLDIYALKDKALTWHWELMFTKSLYGYHLGSQGEILNRVAKLIDDGEIISTVSKTYSPINADQISAAEAELGAGHATGKIVVAN